MKNEALSKKTFLITGILFLGLGIGQAKAGCTGLCIHQDSTGLGSNITDTVYLSSSSPAVTVYGSYNGACAMLMAEDNVTLVWFKDGLPLDTTDMTNAVFDGVWTYTTPLTVTVPGTYTVFFKNFISPAYECGRIVVLPQANNGALATMNPETRHNDFTVFPNPANTQVTISTQETNQEIEILDSFGKLVVTTTVSRLGATINTTSWQKGLYFIRKKGSNDCRRLVVQ